MRSTNAARTRLIEKYRRNGLLIDSNLFLLWVVGSTNESRIARFNRTQKYSVEDFRLLRILVHEFQEVVTSPHILTELSNLATIEEPELRPSDLPFSRSFNARLKFMKRAAPCSSTPHSRNSV